MALIAVLLLVFSFVTYYNGSGSTSIDTGKTADIAADLDGYERSAYNTTDLGRASNYIRTNLTAAIGSSLAIKKQSDDINSTDYTKIVDVGYDASKPAYVVQNFADRGIEYGVDDDTCFDMTGNHTVLAPAKQPVNHIVIVPGSMSKSGKNGDAVLFMTHYDSMPGSTGGTNAVNVASMLSVIEYASTQSYTNDLVFVFTDGRYEESVSAYAFKNQFKGLNDVFSRVKAAFNFDAVTAGGHLALVQSCEYDAGIIAAYDSCAGSTYSDSILSSVQTDIISSDFDIFYDKSSEEWVVPALNFMFINGRYDAESKYDYIAGEGQTGGIDAANAAAQSAALMQKLSDKFGNIEDLSTLSSGMESGYASYFGSTVSMNAAVSYVLASLLLLLICGVVFLIYKKSKTPDDAKKKGGISGMFKGMALAAGVTAASVGIFYAAYFLIGLLLFSFGTISLQMIMTMQYLCAGVLVPAILFAAAVPCGLYPLLKRAFRVKAVDCARGASLVMILFAVVMGYAFPPAAIQLLITGFCLAATMLIVTLLKKPVKTRFSTDIERFMPYAWPMMIAVPFAVPVILSLCNMYLSILLPALLGLFALMLSCITPYFDFLVVPLGKVWAKLPKHKIVVDQSITRDVEDDAKKGKFEKVTTREIITKEVKWRYHNWFGVTVICAVTAVVLLVSGLVSTFGAVVYGSSVVSTFNYTYDTTYESIYSNSMIYYAEKGGDNSQPTSSWLIKDESLFTKTRGVEVGGRFFLNDFEWDSGLEAYKHSLSYNEAEHPVKKNAAVCTASASPATGAFTVDVTPYVGDSSQSVITFDGTTSVKKVVVRRRGNNDKFTIDNISSSPKSITITLPYAYGDCSIDFYGTSASTAPMTSSYITAYEYIFNAERVQSAVTSEAMRVMSAYYSEIEYGMIIKYAYTV